MINKNAVRGFDDLLKANLDTMVNMRVKRGWDYILIIDGLEGNAKSTLATAIANYLDDKFGLDSVKWLPEDIQKLYETLKPEQALVWDEASLGLLSTDFMTKVQKTLVKMFTTKRSKRVIAIICIGDVWLLPSWFATRRAHNLIHCYAKEGLYRGNYKFYSRKKIKKLFYDNVRKARDWNLVKPDFYGYFTKDIALENDLVFNHKEYEANKEEAINKIVGSDNSGTDIWKERSIILMKELNSMKVTQERLGELLGVKRTFISQLVRGKA